MNGLGKRMPGFVWLTEGELGLAITGSRIARDPRFTANLTVCESVGALDRFVWGTIHRRFHERRPEWFEVLGRMHIAMWRVPAGHRPALEEALERLGPPRLMELRTGPSAGGPARRERPEPRHEAGKRRRMTAAPRGVDMS